MLQCGVKWSGGVNICQKLNIEKLCVNLVMHEKEFGSSCKINPFLYYSPNTAKVITKGMNSLERELCVGVGKNISLTQHHLTPVHFSTYKIIKSL